MLEFKPLKQKRGSILLIVVSMMSVLIMLAQALLLSVSVTQQTQVTNFYDKQAYQTSLSISDFISSDIMKGGATSIQKEVLKLKVGETLSTGDNGFSAFGGSAEQLNKVGAYKVDITFLDDNYVSGNDQYKVYEIKVLTNYNGMEEEIASNLYVKETVGKFPGFDRFFTATGYGSGDVFINSSTIMNTAYFDNEFTVIANGKKGAANSISYSNIICGGSLQVENKNFFYEDTSKDIVVRNNLTFSAGDVLKLDGGQVLVGGDLIVNKATIFSGNSKQIEGGSARSSSIFVLGDMKLSNTLTLNGSFDYVMIKGDLNLNGGNLDGRPKNYTFVNGNINFTNSLNLKGNVYYTGKIYKDGNEYKPTENKYQNVSGDAWDYAVNSVVNNTNDNTIVHTVDGELQYYKKGDSESTVKISAASIAAYIDELTTETYYPSFSPSAEFPTSVKQEGGNSGIAFDKENYTYYINAEDHQNGVIIKDISFTGEGYGGAKGTLEGDAIPTFIIENSLKDDKGNPKPLVIRLEENCDDGTFSWTGEKKTPANVIVIGSSPVFFEIAKGTEYVANENDFVGHYAWYAILQSTTGKKNAFYARDQTNPETWLAAQIENGQDINQPTEGAVTKMRSYLYTETDEQNDSEGKIKASTLNITKLRSNEGELTNYSDLLSGAHNNILLISDDKNAEIDMQASKSFFSGYIYAPYMTFRTIGGSSSGMAMAGGLIVSDYVLDDRRGYIFVAPTFDISGLMGGAALESMTTRDWKRSLY